MSMEARIEPLSGPLPSISWRWDSETDILSGAFKGNRKSGGLTGTVELTDEVGSVAVLDVNNGVICGLDVVVWTVNKPEDIEKMLELKVDGIISDRPDLVRAAMEKRKMPLPGATHVDP